MKSSFQQSDMHGRTLRSAASGPAAGPCCAALQVTSMSGWFMGPSTIGGGAWTFQGLWQACNAATKVWREGRTSVRLSTPACTDMAARLQSMLPGMLMVHPACNKSSLNTLTLVLHAALPKRQRAAFTSQSHRERLTNSFTPSVALTWKLAWHVGSLVGECHLCTHALLKSGTPRRQRAG